MYSMSAITLNCLFFLSISCNSVQEFKLNWVKNKDWSIRGQFLREIAERSGYNVFIETGTFEGETAFCASKYFRSVHTIELSHQYYSKAHSRFAYSKSIHVYHGSSVSVLKNILPNINGKIVFWLDAHYSGGGTAKDGALNTPILQELEAIKDCGVKDSIILIDDIRLFDEVSNLSTNQSIHGYPSFKKLCEVILNINPDYNFYFFSDLAIAVPADCVFIVSPIVKACTKSRLFEDEGNVLEVLEYENQIGLAQGIEREVLLNLADTFKCTEDLCKIGKHYRLWNGLILLHENKNKAAIDQFIKASELGLNHWRISWYIAKAAYRCGNYELAKKHIKGVKKATEFSKEAYDIMKHLENG